MRDLEALKAAAEVSLEEVRQGLKGEIDELCEGLKESRARFDQEKKNADNQIAALEQTIA